MEVHRLGNRIRAYRKLKGYTQQQFAEKMGISVAVLGSIERGIREPSGKILEMIVTILNIDVDELVAENNQNSPS